MAMSDRAARMALTAVTEGGDPAVAELVENLGAQGAWAKVVEGLLGEALACRAAGLDAERLSGAAQRSGIRLVVPGDDEWPPGLDRLRFVGPIQRRGGVPLALWVRGPAH